MSASTDISSFLKGLGEARARGIAAARRSVSRFAQHVIGDAQELAPVDTGALKASGTALPAEAKGTEISAQIGFNTNYAAAVHERLDVNHDQGEAKFLETAMRKNTPKMAEFVIDEVRKAL
ncbi:MAG: hypothetical protein WBD40_03565 [Tepidisphaeraceae bacterium]